MRLSDLVRKLQAALNAAGANPRLAEDGNFGPKTAAELDEYEVTVQLKRKPQEPAPSLPKGKTNAPWLDEAKKSEGKRETDPEFNKRMSAKWGLVGLNLGTIAKNWAAWCGLFIAVSLSGAGYQWAKNGAAARNWGSFGVAVDWKNDGIPRGAIVWINHGANCNASSNNHVTMSDGDCAPEDLKKKNATFNGFGGNQGNQAKVSGYPVAHICAVRWPADAAKPGRVEKSSGCNGDPSSGESTR